MSERGTVKIRFAGPVELPDEVQLFFTEHSPKREQHRIKTKPGKGVATVSLPPGEYTMQILARGYETIRGLVKVNAESPSSVDAVLKPRKKRVRTFEERLAKYGIDAKKMEIGELRVPARTTRVLNYQTDREKRGFVMLRANTIAQVKQWVGSDDTRFGHKRPVFGRLPARKLIARADEVGHDIHKLNAVEREAIAAIAREYVQGNSSAVTQYESVLNKFIIEMCEIPLYVYTVVTIEAGATLEVGNGSAVFACDELRIHKTGTLKPVKSVTIEIGTYTEFE
jgi:hypothetical protein